MIETTKAVPYGVMKAYLEGDECNLISSMAKSFDKVWLISITSESLTPLFQDGEDRIALEFDDVEDSYDSYSGITKPRNPLYTYFDEAMARKVVNFVRKAHAGEGRDLLVANCHMGVSRSGAVSDFVRSVCGIDYSDWKRMNPQVNPNLLVKDLLHWTWNEKTL